MAGGIPTNIGNYFQNLLGSTSSGGGLLGLLGFGSANPLYNLMALDSYVNEGILTQEQTDFIKKVLSEQSGAMSTASDPTKLAASISALGGDLTSHSPAVKGMQPLMDPSRDAIMGALNATPESTAAGINAMTQPLSKQLYSSVTNPINAQLASEGLATSPGIAASTYATALAPFEQQEQQMGQSAYQNMIGNALTSGQFDVSQMNQLLEFLQGQGQSAEQFGLSLPFQAQPKYPDFGVTQAPQNDLLSLLNGAGTGSGALNFSDPLNLIGGQPNLSNLNTSSYWSAFGGPASPTRVLGGP